MGNSANSLPYDVGAAQPYEGNKHWQLSSGTKKDDGTEKTKLEVTLFRFAKSQTDKSSLATRFHQKLRTLKHPYILSYQDGADLGDSVVVVTESCVPLATWLDSHKISSSPSTSTSLDEAKEVLLQEVLWGFKCVLNGLSFLHSTCNMAHNYLGLHAIFVCKNGDWKLGALDLAGNLANSEDLELLRQHGALLEAPYRAPERIQFSREGSAAALPDAKLQGSADIYSLAHVMTGATETLQLAPLPANLSKLLTSMTSSDVRRRPTATSLIRHAVFNSEHIQLLSNLGELSIKPASECAEILQNIASKVSAIPKSVCQHQLLPSIMRMLQMAVNDFSNRDSRENCRQSIQLCISLIAKLAQENKIEATNLQTEAVPIIVTLWGMSDRTVRTSLLTSMPQIIPLLSDAVVNKSIFDPLLNGFADSNAKMREETLKSLVHIVNRLDEKNLQEKLVRCIVQLQSDAEASVRTNVTIFLGRIATKLKEAVRAKVLCNCCCKAMKDAFVHCRVAGLKAAMASLDLLDGAQVASKLLPQVCLLVLDKSKDVRELSLRLLETGTQKLHQFHNQLTQQELAQAAKRPAGSGSSGNLSGANKDEEGGAGSTGASWTSWAVEGLSKTLDIAATTAAGNSNIATSSSSGNIGNLTNPKYASSPNSTHVASGSGASSGAGSAGKSITPIAYSKTVAKKALAEDSWGDEIEDEYFADSTAPVPGTTNNSSKPNSSTRGATVGSSVATKLTVDEADNDNWDVDFDVELDEDNNCSDSNTAEPGGFQLSTPARRSEWPDDDDDSLGLRTPPRHPSSSTATAATSAATSSKTGTGGMLSISGKTGSKTNSSSGLKTTATPGAKKEVTSSIKTSNSNTSISSNPAAGAAQQTPSKKPAVTKLSVDDGDNWDDF